jgi:hypothetical protein
VELDHITVRAMGGTLLISQATASLARFTCI